MRHVHGLPLLQNSYVKVAITYPLSRLYMLMPTIQWWFVYSHLLLSIGMVIINVSLLKQVDKLESRRPIAYALILVLNLGLFLHVVDSISFTAIPAVLCSAVACIFVMAEQRLRAGRMVLLAALLLLAYCHRILSFYAGLPFVALAIAYYAYRHRSYGLTIFASCAKFVLVMLIAVLVANAANVSIRAQIDGQDFLDFYKARSNYMDYKHDTYESNPELYDSVGWDKTLYDLVQRWCFLDERVNTDSFNHLANNSEARARSNNIGEISARLSALMSDQESPFVLCVIACLALLALLATRHHRLDLLLVAAVAVTALAILAYQVLTGRILYRAMIATALPAAVLLCAALLPHLHNVGKSSRTLWACRIACGIELVLATVICFSLLNPTRIETIRSACEKGDSAANYASLHPGNVYVRGTDVPLTLNPRATYEGSVTSTPPDNLDKSGSNRPGTAFYSWLKENYGATAYELVDTVCDDVYVYHFAFGQD